MALTDSQKKLVQQSFVKVAVIADKAAELFYGRLFEVAPNVKPLFANTNMKEQGSKLMQMIGTAVGGLDRLEDIVPHVQALGKRHVAYGVKKEDYTPVGEALLWTLEQGLGADFTPDVKAAWAEVYGVLANTAIEAAYKQKMTPDEMKTKVGQEKKVDLTSYDLIGANLGGVSLNGTQLTGANLTGANLTNVDFSGATLINADLSGANLTNANLSHAKLVGTKLIGANLTAAQLPSAEMPECDLSGATLTAADLTGCNMKDTKMMGALLICSNLSGAKLDQANMTGAILTGANLTRASLVNANLRGANLTVANMEGANLEGAKLTGVIGYDQRPA